MQRAEDAGIGGAGEDLKKKEPTLSIAESLKPASISLCMIAKNEEKNIGRSLSSVRPVVDEMIVVDTGSTDRTRDIARSLGAKVYDHPWKNDFSDARNFSLSKASGKWILVLDADEVISHLDHGKLLELVRMPRDPEGEGGPTAYSFVTRNYSDSTGIVVWRPNDGRYPSEEAGAGWFGSEKVRLFPNDERVRFENPVHELVEDSLSRSGFLIKKSGIPVHHYGKLNAEELSLKGKEYYELGKKKLAEKGGQDIKALCELALQATELGKHEEAIEYWDRVTEAEKDIPEAFFYKGINYFLLEKYEDALSCLKRAVELDPESAEIVLVYSKYEIYAGDPKTSISQLERLLKREPDNVKAMAALSTAYICTGKKDKGTGLLQKLKDKGFASSRYLHEFAKILVSAQRFGYAASLLETAIETNNAIDETRTLLDECYRMQGFGGRPAATPDEGEGRPPSARERKDEISMSLCMIARNEEKNIARALSSAKPLVDEMIVVDTGSTDGTREIARSLGAKVYDHPWKNDFSDARNFALSKATGKWVLILDADEVISPLDHKELRGLIAPAGPTGGKDRPVAYTFTTRNYVNEFNVSGWTANDGLYPEEAGTGWFPGDKVRLFPVDERIHFEKAVHERIEPSLLNAGIDIRKCNIPVHHYGMLNKEEVSAKNSYYYNLGKSRIAEKGGRDVAALYDLAVQAAGIGKHEEALGYLNEVIAARPDFSKAFASMGNIYYNLRRYEDALSAYGKAIDGGHKSRDTFLMYATCKVLTGNAESVIPLLEGTLKTDDEHPRTLLLLAEAYFCAERKEKGMELMRKLTEIGIDAGKYFTGFAKVLMSAGRLDYAVSLLGSVVQDGAGGEAGALLAECRKIMKK